VKSIIRAAASVALRFPVMDESFNVGAQRAYSFLINYSKVEWERERKKKRERESVSELINGNEMYEFLHKNQNENFLYYLAYRIAMLSIFNIDDKILMQNPRFLIGWSLETSTLLCDSSL